MRTLHNLHICRHCPGLGSNTRPELMTHLSKMHPNLYLELPKCPKLMFAAEEQYGSYALEAHKNYRCLCLTSRNLESGIWR